MVTLAIDTAVKLESLSGLSEHAIRSVSEQARLESTFALARECLGHAVAEARGGSA
jgi:hypothetical protein